MSIKKARQKGALHKSSDPIPEVFFSLAKKYPGKVLLGEGRKKIFEIRSNREILELNVLIS